MALRLTQAADYAIRGMLYVASFPEGRLVLRSEIAAAEEIPNSFTAKILRSLVQAGLLRSSRGVGGGFALARPAWEINLLQIVEAVEGPIEIVPCATDSARCGLSPNCPARTVWESVQHQIVDTLSGSTLEALVSAPRRNGLVVFQPRM